MTVHDPPLGVIVPSIAEGLGARWRARVRLMIGIVGNAERPIDAAACRQLGISVDVQAISAADGGSIDDSSGSAQEGPQTPSESKET